MGSGAGDGHASHVCFTSRTWQLGFVGTHLAGAVRGTGGSWHFYFITQLLGALLCRRDGGSRFFLRPAAGIVPLVPACMYGCLSS